MLELFPSLVSGLCAASAGLAGKFAFAPLEDEGWGGLGLRGFGVVGMLVLNALMIQFFVKSIAVLGASRATLANFTCNYLASAFLGWMFYGEALSMQWSLGAGLMLLGVYFVQRAR